MIRPSKYPLTMLGMIVLIVAFYTPAFAQAANAQDTPNLTSAVDARTIITALNDATEKLKETSILKTTEVTDALDNLAEAVSQALVIVKANRQAEEQEEMPYSSDFSSTALEQTRGKILAEALASNLDTVNLQTVLGYENVMDQGMDSSPNIYKDGLSPAMAQLYGLWVDLFCIPGMPNMPANCGAGRSTYGLTGDENFVDFFLGEKSWKQSTVLEVMKLARAYFGYIPDTTDLSQVALEPGNFIKLQGNIAKSNLRISIINYLASRRGPTSGATFSVLETALQTFASTGAVSSFDYNDICSPTPVDETPTAAEQYLCSFTSGPAPGTGTPTPANASPPPRIISQAAVDRLTQFDFYMNSDFYARLNSKDTRRGSVDRLEVYMKAQQLAQDYHALRLLQMKTAAVAMKIMNEDNPATSSGAGGATGD